MGALIYPTKKVHEAEETLRGKRVIGFDKDGVVVDISELVFQNRKRGFEKHGIEFPYDSETNYKLGGISNKYNGGTAPILALIAFGRWHDGQRRPDLSKSDAFRELVRSTSANNKLEQLVLKYTSGSDNELAERIYWWDEGKFFGSDDGASYVKPCEGAREAIMNISEMLGGRIAIITNTHSEKTTMRDLLVAGFDSSDLTGFEIVHDAKKPSPECIGHMLDKFRLDRVDAAYVGDGIIDINTARNAGVSAVSVLSGMGSLHILKKGRPDVIVKDVVALHEILRS